MRIHLKIGDSHAISVLIKEFAFLGNGYHKLFNTATASDHDDPCNPLNILDQQYDSAQPIMV